MHRKVRFPARHASWYIDLMQGIPCQNAPFRRCTVPSRMAAAHSCTAKKAASPGDILLQHGLYSLRTTFLFFYLSLLKIVFSFLILTLMSYPCKRGSTGFPAALHGKEFAVPPAAASAIRWTSRRHARPLLALSSARYHLHGSARSVGHLGCAFALTSGSAHLWQASAAARDPPREENGQWCTPCLHIEEMPPPAPRAPAAPTHARPRSCLQPLWPAQPFSLSA